MIRIIFSLAFLAGIGIALWVPEWVPKENWTLFAICFSILTIAYVFGKVKSDINLKSLTGRNAVTVDELESANKHLDTPQYVDALVSGLDESQAWAVQIGVRPREPFRFFAHEEVFGRTLARVEDRARYSKPNDFISLPRSAYEQIVTPPGSPLKILAFGKTYTAEPSSKKTGSGNLDYCPECGR